MNLNDLKELGVDTILDCLADGAYATDTDRRILFWNRAAERITGWKREDVVGRRCRDNILVHVDIDGHPLCRTEFCPLHRAMATGKSSAKPMLVFARTKDGGRVPVEATVGPLRDEENATIGGIEVFRDMTPAMAELERARVIQQHALYSPVEPDSRFEFANRYVPESIIGGDFYRIERVDEDRYGFMVADVMGHGVSAALYCMQLRALWDEHRDLLSDPGRFLTAINRSLHVLTQYDDHFATAFYMGLDMATGEGVYASAGHPPALALARDGETMPLKATGPGLGLLPDSAYEGSATRLDKGDTLLLYTDAAIEVENGHETALGPEGFRDLIQRENVGEGSLSNALGRVEEALLKYSNSLRLSDDLTLLAARRTS